MFTNLIESNAHTREFRRRGSFFLITVAAYCLVLFAAGVAGVLTYEATVEAQNNDIALLNWVPPVNAVTPDRPRETRPARPAARPNAPVDPNIRIAERTQPQGPATDPTKIPDEIGTKGSEAPPAIGPVVQSTRNVDPPASQSGDQGTCTTCTSSTPVVEAKPEPTPGPKPPTQTVPSRVLVSKAVSLPQPPYPQIAKQAGVQGAVNVQILVDESGKVISARAVSGSAMLTRAAEDAAKRARFTPTTLNDQPVKVQGLITYNFVLQ